MTTVLKASHKLKHKRSYDQMLWSGPCMQASRISWSMASCLYFGPDGVLLPCAVPYASIFCIIVHGIVFLTIYLNLPPAWHLIQRNHGLQAYNIHHKRICAQTQSIPDFWHWHCYTDLPDQNRWQAGMHDLPLRYLPSTHVTCMQDPTFDGACHICAGCNAWSCM